MTTPAAAAATSTTSLTTTSTTMTTPAAAATAAAATPTTSTTMTSTTPAGHVHSLARDLYNRNLDLRAQLEAQHLLQKAKSKLPGLVVWNSDDESTTDPDSARGSPTEIISLSATNDPSNYDTDADADADPDSDSDSAILTTPSITTTDQEASTPEPGLVVSIVDANTPDADADALSDSSSDMETSFEDSIDYGSDDERFFPSVKKPTDITSDLELAKLLQQQEDQQLDTHKVESEDDRPFTVVESRSTRRRKQKQMRQQQHEELLKQWEQEELQKQLQHEKDQENQRENQRLAQLKKQVDNRVKAELQKSYDAATVGRKGQQKHSSPPKPPAALFDSSVRFQQTPKKSIRSDNGAGVDKPTKPYCYAADTNQNKLMSAADSGAKSPPFNGTSSPNTNFSSPFQTTPETSPPVDDQNKRNIVIPASKSIIEAINLFNHGPQCYVEESDTSSKPNSNSGRVTNKRKHKRSHRKGSTTSTNATASKTVPAVASSPLLNPQPSNRASQHDSLPIIPQNPFTQQQQEYQQRMYYHQHIHHHLSYPRGYSPNFAAQNGPGNFSTMPAHQNSQFMPLGYMFPPQTGATQGQLAGNDEDSYYHSLNQYSYPYYPFNAHVPPPSTYGYPSPTADSATTTNATNTASLDDRINRQVSYYFSIENLCKDSFLRSLFDPDTGGVELKELAKFRRLRLLIHGDLELLERVLEVGCAELLDILPATETKGVSVRVKEWERWLLPPKKRS